MTLEEPRPIAVLGAASSIGIRPYDGDREVRQLHRAPGVLRQHGLIERLSRPREDSVQDHPRDGAQYHPRDGIQDHPRDSSQDHPRGGVQDHLRDRTQAHPRNGIQSHPRDGIPDHPRDGVPDHPRGGIQDHPRDGIQDHPLDGIQEHLRDSGQDHLRDGIHAHPRDGNQDYPLDGIQDHPRDSGQDHPRDSSQAHPRDGIQEHPRDSSQGRRLVIDLGDIAPPPYRDYVRPPGRVRNEREVGDYNRQLAERVAIGIDDGRFVVVLGGDCSIVLGSLLGASRGGTRRIGLAYLDANADFATPQESGTGSAASMCLALAVGRGDSSLAQLGDGGRALVRAEDTVLVGRRESGDANYGDAALRDSDILDLTDAFDVDPDLTASRILDRLARPELDGFWIHIDADVLDPRVMFAIDSPEPGGPDYDQVAAVVSRLARHPRALGLQLTIYDPKLDPDHVCAQKLVDMLVASLGERS